MINQKSAFYKTVAGWLPLAIALVIFSGLIYVAVQQNFRMSANDPQIQVAEDIAQAIAEGTPAESIVPAAPTANLSPSLATFVIIYDGSGNPIGSSVQLDGKIPSMPKGVFAQAKKTGQNRLTWQPKAGIRIAAVVTTFSGKADGYVVVGRSLREVEIRTQQLTIMTAAATGIALVLTFLVMFYFIRNEHREYHRRLAEMASSEKKD